MINANPTKYKLAYTKKDVRKELLLVYEQVPYKYDIGIYPQNQDYPLNYNDYNVKLFITKFEYKS